MRKFFFFVVVVLISLSASLSAQCTFKTPTNYGFLCDEARFLCGSNLDGYSGRLLSTLSPTPQPDPICGGTGSPENTQWFAFLADDSNLEIEISYSNCSGGTLGPGITVGLYKDCVFDNGTGTNQSALTCDTDQSYNNVILKADPLEIIPGRIYYLFVDGYAGGACDFQISVNSGVCTEAPPSSVDCAQDCGVSNTYGDSFGCTTGVEQYDYHVTSQVITDMMGCTGVVNNAKLDSIVCIEWEILPPTGFSATGTFQYYDSLDVFSTLDVQWDTPGTYTIRPIVNFNPLFSTCSAMCDCTDALAYTVVISTTDTVKLPEIEVCPGDCVDFFGTQYCSTQLLSHFDRNNCILTTQELMVKQVQFVDLGEIYICPDDCFEFNNVEYCTENIFSVPHPTACDTSYSFELKNIEITPSFAIAESVLNCNTTEAQLQGEWSTNYSGTINSFWIYENGDTVSRTSDYIATLPGQYTFHVVPEKIEGCATSLTHNIILDVEAPTVSLNAPALDCTTTTGQITLSTIATLTDYLWSGPNGFSSTDREPNIAEKGSYTVTVTASNGCTSTENVIVSKDDKKPTVTVSYQDIDCSDNMHVATFTSTLSTSNVLWTNPAGDQFTSDLLNITQPGTYNLMVTAMNGCTDEESFVVSDLSYDPTVDRFTDVILRCNDSITELNLSVLPNGFTHEIFNINEGVPTPLNGLTNHTIKGEGTYIITSKDESLGCIGYDTIRIIKDGNIFSDIKFDILAPLCSGADEGTIAITNIIGGQGPYNFLYNNESYESLNTVQFPVGNHVFLATDVFGCEVEVAFEMPEGIQFTIMNPTNVIFDYGAINTITAETDLPDENINSIVWTDPEGNILSTNKDLVTDKTFDSVTVTITNTDGCIESATIAIKINYAVEIYYPNIFSPNNDGHNDYFIIFNNGEPQMIDDLKIYDRAGELMYQSSRIPFNETNSGWDGTFNGSPANPGVYVFTLHYTLGNGEKHNLTGTVTVIR